MALAALASVGAGGAVPAAEVLVGLLAACASQVLFAATADAPDNSIFETNITKDLNLSSGEPQIAVDPTNPRNIAMIEFAIGSSKAPAYSLNPILDPKTPEQKAIATMHNGRIVLSKDGGHSWTVRAAPAFDPTIWPHKGGGDPMIAYGPDGALYVADCVSPASATVNIKVSLAELQSAALRAVNMFITASMDGGQTFTVPQPLETPRDRPWLKVDESTGTVYTASTGPFNPKTKVYNVPGDDAPFDRWLTAWQPHLVGHSEPRRLGGPDFSAAGGSTMTAANGTLAAVFIIGLPQPLGKSRGEPVPVPASLQGLIKDGTTSCSLAAPCLFFETSSDEGQTWKRHHVAVPGGLSGPFSHVAADAGRPGRYAIGVLNQSGTNLRVLVTDDDGETWSGPHTIPETAQGADFKQWMDYGPTGVLGLMWKKRRDDLSTPPPPSMTQLVGQTWGPAFDVYAAISCDGGNTWLPPLRVNAETSPSGPNGFDDLSYLAMDAHQAHLVWGDRRNLSKVTNAPTGVGGLQAYYGRVPFSSVSNGAACGR
jgi:hypothetical protein